MIIFKMTPEAMIGYKAYVHVLLIQTTFVIDTTLSNVPPWELCTVIAHASTMGNCKRLHLHSYHIIHIYRYIDDLLIVTLSVTYGFIPCAPSYAFIADSAD
jgi:hypothetical protein